MHQDSRMLLNDIMNFTNKNIQVNARLSIHRKTNVKSRVKTYAASEGKSDENKRRKKREEHFLFTYIRRRYFFGCRDAIFHTE